MSITRNKLIYLGMIIISVILIIHSSLALINYMITDKYHIDENFDHSDLIYTYKSRKIEIEIILLYLNLFIGYFSIITIYFIHKIYKKKENTKVVDKYDLLNNNCTTKTSEVEKITTDRKLDLKSFTPINRDTKLYYIYQEGNSEIERICIKKNTKSTSDNKPIYQGLITVSIILIIFCTLDMINYMLSYKYQIAQNFNQADLTITYKTRKIEIGIILFGLKVFIGYIFIFTIYFIHKLFQKNNTK